MLFSVVCKFLIKSDYARKGTTQPHVHSVPEIKRQHCKANYSSPSHANVQNAWRFTSVPHTILYRGA